MADDEFSYLPDNASEVGLPWKGAPAIRRTSVGVGGGREVSAIVWGSAQADLVLCRSGATTAAELTAAGKASVLVPFARAADDHQRGNARALEAAGAARMIEEKDLTPERLAAVVTELLSDPAKLTAMEEAARTLARPDAAARVADLLEGKVA